MKTIHLLTAVFLGLSLAACGTGEYAVPSRAVSQDIAAAHWSGAGDTSSSQMLDFRDSDILSLSGRR
jgi:hypothetical protein